VALGGLPVDVRAVLAEFRCCELATISRDGTPLTWPAVPLMLAEGDRFLLTTSIALTA
jgi:hypothetical protein